mmetsp:Transcript_7645/g.12890  ORF Transcript_7645/g.12890 Transcript_7645/m.12890 type:complete len:144 (+) Transcript_7645:70-501(+)
MWGASSGSKSRFSSSPGSYSSSRNIAYTPVKTDDNPNHGDDDSHDERQFMKLQIKQQDQNLDVLESSVQNLNRLSLSISTELKEQSAILDELDRDTEHAMDTIELITKKTQDLIKKSGGAKYFSIIVCLTIILIILTLLVIYT